MPTLRVLAALLLTLAALASGCGEERQARRAGNFQALRLRRDVPRHARLGTNDIELVHVPAGALPDHRRYPRAAEEVLGATMRLARRAGSLLQDGHIDRHPLAPEAGATTLEAGELGLLAPLVGLPPEAAAGSVLRVQDGPGPLRLAAVSPPGPEARDALLAASETTMLEWARRGPRFPVQFLALVEGPFWIASRELPAGHSLGPGDLVPHSVPPSLAPPGAILSQDAGIGRQLRTAVLEGEVVTGSMLAAPAPLAEASALYVPGLYPDWLHPGATALYMRAGSRGPPVEVEVLDMDRAALGAPVPLTVRPLPGEAWPGAVARTAGEGGQRRWVLLLAR
jgi:flagella basal body P-ring formation protein FlgA